MATNIQERVVVGVRFMPVGKLYHFDASAYPDVKPLDYVIVETSRGRQLGKIAAIIPPEKAERHIKAIQGPATARDLMLQKLYEAKELEALIDVREIASGFKELEVAKFVKAEYNYDGSMLSVTYTCEDPINTGGLRRKLEQHFETRVDLRRIGSRDAAKVLGEYGACGAPRCCSSHLSEFSPISIKMAKAQGISLNPSEITGMCGRLRCCLIYEYEQYLEAKKHLPKKGKRIGTPHGPGRVIALNPLAETATVIVNEERHELHRDQLIPLEELEALKEKSAMGCTKEGTGPCECGARVRGEHTPPAGQGPASSEQPRSEKQGDRPSGGRRRGRRRRGRRRRGGRGRGRQGDRGQDGPKQS